MNAISKKDTIFVAGHNGMVGAGFVRALSNDDGCQLITRSRSELDLTDQAAVRRFFSEHQVDRVILAAARVGGIYANNTYPAEFIYQNLMVECNVINEAWAAGVNSLLFLGSSCIYPKFAPQPMQESALLTGKLEPTNEPYAVAKIAGIKLCESYNRQYGVDYRAVMPTNLYGIGDSYHPKDSHVIPALIQRIHQAKSTNSPSVEIWGSGKAKREFLYVDDMVDASLFVMNMDKEELQKYNDEMESHINVGYGEDVAIFDLALIIKDAVGYRGEIVCDTSKPDGPPRKLLNSDKLRSMGWQPKVSLQVGIERAYQDYLQRSEIGLKA
jgi:GDP-L-fucose synthase